MNAPGVDPNIIGEIPDLHAKRVVAEMLEFLDVQVDAIQPRLHAAIIQPIGGHPVSQQKYVERVRQTRSPAIIDMAFYVGKRCKFGLAVSLWDTEADVGGGAVVWQYIASANGPGTEKRRFGPYWRISNHALVRLVQRSGATDAGKLLEVMRRLAGPVIEAMARARLRANDGQTLHVNFSSGTAVVEWPAGAPLAVVKTILAPDMPAKFRSKLH